ncbi:proteoglycan 3-like [Phyllobates terribilis]|uniref:proteoglycan 3-like n=1 Tax=Phyllobates terribilis TaxID=111132 RepID=UPI003CCB4FFA
MWKLLLLLVVGTTLAQESGDYPQEIDDQLLRVANDEYNDENELDEEDLSVNEESDCIEPDFTEKAEDAACPNKATCSYHIFFRPRRFYRATRVCRNWRGDLSSIHSSKINSYLQRFLRGIVKNSSYVWIGIWKKKTRRSYWNIDGTKWSYTNFAAKQRKSSGRWCVAMNINSGKWYSLNCQTELPFICAFGELN